TTSTPGVARPASWRHGTRSLLPGTDELNDGGGIRPDQRPAPRVMPEQGQSQAPEAGSQDRRETEAVRPPPLRQLPPAECEESQRKVAQVTRYIKQFGADLASERASFGSRTGGCGQLGGSRQPRRRPAIQPERP